MARTSKAGVMAAVAMGFLGASILLGGVFPTVEPELVVVGVIGYLACGARAMTLWGAGEQVFERRRTGRHIAIAAVVLAGAAATASAQQTIFNVPSADVLDRGKVYAEVDELFRPTSPRFSATTIRGVVGVLPCTEAGVNFGGLNAPGPAVPTATVAVKTQPVRVGGFALTAGGNGLFYLDAGDGDPAGLGYGFASYRIPGLGTRVEVGGWYSSAGYALPGSTGGALATFEQPLPWIPGLSVAADWFSGESSIGYLSPGLIYTFGPWSAYAAYTIKNGDSAGDGGLIELGYAF